MLKNSIAIFLCLAIADKLQAQEIVPVEKANIPSLAIKTNLLYDATTTLNLGVEFGLSRKLTLDIPVSYNPWTFSNNKKWKHLLVQPELRMWTGERFAGHFFGLHTHYALYNVGGLNSPPFSEYMNEHRFEGWLAGAGISYGYRWNFNHRWGLEATIGVGYAYLSYDKYACENCGAKLGSETKNYFGPTKIGINLIYSIGGKKAPKAAAPVAPAAVPVAVPVAPKAIYQPQFAVSYITPEVEQVKMRSAVCKAYLDFAAGNPVIDPDFKNNAAELDKVHAMISDVKGDSNTTISGITIIGYASPEGTYSSNLNLSKKRAIALKQLIKASYSLPESLFTAIGSGEDWDMLDSLVAHSSMSDKQAILEIIRATDIFDGREKKLMHLSGGDTYRQMLSELFPKLRRSDIELRYIVLPFTVEKGKEVFKTHPGRLSLNELFMIAQAYPAGSDQYNEVFETAARIFPNSDTANLNAAASTISRKDALSAGKYLEKIKQPDTHFYNNKGIVLYMQGDYTQAMEYFKRAAAGRNPQAAQNLAELQKYLQSKE